MSSIRAESPYHLIPFPSAWTFQYPSGTIDGGMLEVPVNQDLKSKYISLYQNPNGMEYIRFSLDASDQGKSLNASSVRAELANYDKWRLTGRHSMTYTFYLESTDFNEAKFTVGQFLQNCTIKDSPLCRIEMKKGSIYAKVKNFDATGLNTTDGTDKLHVYELGRIHPKQETTIKLSLDNKSLCIDRDGKFFATHNFSDGVSTENTNYFKIGIYYQNKNSPKIFTEVFVRDLKVEIPSE